MANDNSIMHPITINELSPILKTLLHWKSPGPDGIPYKIYMKYHKIITPTLLSLFNHYLSNSIFIPGSSNSFFIMLFKKYDKQNLGNWGSITLSNTDAKILSKILTTRIYKYTQNILSPNQYSFISRCLIHSNIFLITNVLWSSLTTRSLYFLDQKKAYIQVD